MVCPRCISSVGAILKNQGIPFEEVSLGKVLLKKKLSEEEIKKLEPELKKEGFELVTDKHHRLSNQIKSLIILTVFVF